MAYIIRQNAQKKAKQLSPVMIWLCDGMLDRVDLACSGGVGSRAKHRSDVSPQFFLAHLWKGNDELTPLAVQW